MQRNFILTDIMKTGNHPMLEDFINLQPRVISESNQSSGENND